MQNKTGLIAVPFLIMLGACSSTDDVADALDELTNTTIDIASVSGNTGDISGTWKTNCARGDGAGDSNETLTFASLAVEYTNASYTSTDGSCTGTETVNMSYTAAVQVGSNDAIGGWQDGTGATTTAPDAADGSGSLSDTESFTGLTYTFSTLSGIEGVAVGDSHNTFYILDDTATNSSTLYRGDYTEQSTLTGAFGQVFDSFVKQ